MRRVHPRVNYRYNLRRGTVFVFFCTHKGNMRQETSLSRTVPYVLAATLIVAWLTSVKRRRVRTVRLHLVRDEHGNEALILDTMLAGSFPSSLFLLDTAYAGAPVLSTSYLSLLLEQTESCRGDVQTRYRRALRTLNEKVTSSSRHAAVDALLYKTTCRAFVSGCTQRLMGIGETTELHADMLLCPPLQHAGVGSLDAADVFVTNPLPGSVNILTCDYLLHHAPCVLRPKEGLLHLGLTRGEAWATRSTFSFVPVRMVGGAFSVPMTVGGTPLQLVVDTGAGAALSLGKSALSKIAESEPTARRAHQVGVHGEVVCSDVLLATVRCGSWSPDGLVEIFANDTELQGEADGYVGMGLLRCLDLWLEPGALGFRPSGLAPRRSEVTSEGRCHST